MKNYASSGLSLLVLLSCILWAGASARAASAHALLARSLPEADAVLSQSPATIELWFTEALEPDFSRARLFNATGQEVPVGVASLDPSDETHMTLRAGSLAPGVYTVAWQTLSKADGHEFSGSFPFTLLNPDGSRPGGGPAEVAGAARGDLPVPGKLLARYLLLLGSMLLFGTALFQFRIVPNKFQASLPEALPVENAARNLAAVVIWGSVLAVTLGQSLHILLQVMDLGGLNRLPGLLFGTRAGALMLSRQVISLSVLLVALRLPQPRPINRYLRPARVVIALLVALLGVLLIPAAVQGEYVLTFPAMAIAYLSLGWVIWARGELTPAIWRKILFFFVVLGSVLLFDISLGSHAGAGAGSFWAVLADFVHLLAAGAWVGGLLTLGVLLWKQYRLPEEERLLGHRPLLELVRRFSYLAGFCVFVLVLTGLFNSLVQLPALPLLWQTSYGRVLVLKLAFIMAAMGIAFLNNRLAHHQGSRRKMTHTILHLDRQVALEVGVVLLLMVSVAVLVQTPTPRDIALANTPQPGLPFNQVLTADDLSLHVQVSPNQVGKGRFWMHVYHADGSPVGDIQLVQLRFNYRDVPMGQSKVDLSSLGGDAFAAEGAYLSQAGVWDLSAYIRRRDADDTLANFSLDVPKSVSAINASSPWQNPIPTIPPALLVVGVLISFAAIPILWHRPLRRAWTYYRFSLYGTILLTLSGLVIGLVYLLSPEAGQAVSYERGKGIYDQQCMSCHGPTGRGDGPAAAGLNPPPANLQVHLAGGAHSDDQIFLWISNGIPKSAMPAFRTLLSEEERWQVVNYLRTLVPNSVP